MTMSFPEFNPGLGLTGDANVQAALALPARPQPRLAAAGAAQRAVARAPALFEGGAVGTGGSGVTGDVHSSASG